MFPLLMNALVFILGLCLGSFLNVVIYRLPRPDLSISRPRRSACPGCGAGIKWYDNLPVLSYLILRGRCRNCGGRISIRYPLVELAAGGLTLAVFLKSGLTGRTLIELYLVLALLAISFIDFDLKVIPDQLTFPGMALGLVSAAIRPDPELLGPWLNAWINRGWGFSSLGWISLGWAVMVCGLLYIILDLIRELGLICFRNEPEPAEAEDDSEEETEVDWGRRLIYLAGAVLAVSIVTVVFYFNQDWLVAAARSVRLRSLLGSALGLFVGYGLVWLIFEVYFYLRHGEGIGGGDATLLAMIGAILGWGALPLTVFIGSVTGIAGAILLGREKGEFGLKMEVPFGPFLSLGALIHFFFGAELLAWYLGLFG